MIIDFIFEHCRPDHGINHQEFGDYDVRFLHPSGVKPAYWFPDDERERCFKTRDQILSVLPNPGLTGGTRIRYAFLTENVKAAMRLLKNKE